MRIERGGASLNASVSGSGTTTLVFLHYWGGSSRTWNHVRRLLPDCFQTVATDHRGWGESTADNENYGLSALADDAMAIVDAMGLDRYVLVGHSMGGKVAQLIASRRPRGLAGLALVAPASPGPSAFPLDQRMTMAHAYDSRESVIATVEHVLAGKRLSPDDLELVVQDSLRGTPGAKIAWPMTTMMEDIGPAISSIDVPVLVVGGELDKVDPVTGLREEVVARIPGAALEVLAGTGHLSPLESPRELANILARFATSL